MPNAGPAIDACVSEYSDLFYLALFYLAQLVLAQLVHQVQIQILRINGDSNVLVRI